MEQALGEQERDTGGRLAGCRGAGDRHRRKISRLKGSRKETQEAVKQAAWEQERDTGCSSADWGRAGERNRREISNVEGSKRET